MNNQLFFGEGKNNQKAAKLEALLGKKVFTFSLPAGYTCPGADKCHARFDRVAHAIVDGPRAEFRCFAASLEKAFEGFRDHNSINLALLKGSDDMVALILAALPGKAQIVRIHVSGDFFSERYFLAWCEVARARPGIEFYAYTKSLRFWTNNLDLVPGNLHLTASVGGKFDVLIGQYGLKSSQVVFSLEEAAILGLEIDHDDSHAAVGESSFALLIHGQQPKGSTAAAALKALPKEGK